MADKRDIINQLISNYMRTAGIKRSHAVVNLLMNNDDDNGDFIVRVLRQEYSLFIEVLTTTLPTIMSFLADNGNPFRGNDTRKMKEFMDYLLYMDTDMFRCQLRISKEMYLWLFTELKPCIDKLDGGPGKPRISSTIQIACALW